MDALLPAQKKKDPNSLELLSDPAKDDTEETALVKQESGSMQSTREKLRQRLRSEKLENSVIEIEVDENRYPGVGVLSGMGNEDMMIQIQDAFGNIFPKQTRKKKVTVREARRIFEQEEAQKIIDMDEVIDEALTLAEQDGIVFLDEIDKVAGSGMGQSPDVSREGVQRDILPIVEGTTVMTKYGPVKTDYMLFIAAGAFHVSKVSDLIPELQGRFPIRVELKSLTEDNFRQILTQPENAIIKQQVALMKTEGVHLVFTDDAIDEIARMSYVINQSEENIGARRLHTVMEKLLEDLSFHAEDLYGQTITVNRAFVQQSLTDMIRKTDLHKYIL